MLPNSAENILQDTKNVPDTPVSERNSARKLVVILVSILAIGFIVKQFTPKSTYPTTVSTATSVEPTSQPLTHTFVDSVFGTVLFFRDSTPITVRLPDRVEHIILGVAKEAEVPLSSQYPPVWSPDGKRVAMVSPEQKIVVSDYDSGRYVGTFPLPANSTSETVTFSIDPASEVLAVSQTASTSTDASVRFFSLQTQKELGVYPRCSGAGVWMTGVGFAMTCTVADSQSVVVIRFEPSSSVMTPLLREANGIKYQVIDEYRPGVLMLKKSTGSHTDLITLEADGKVKLIPPKDYKAVPDIYTIVHITDALRARIEKTAHTKPVRDLSVASDNSFVVFETEDGLYVAKLDLKDPPYFLGKGTMPRIRPN